MHRRKRQSPISLAGIPSFLPPVSIQQATLCLLLCPIGLILRRLCFGGSAPAVGGSHGPASRLAGYVTALRAERAKTFGVAGADSLDRNI
jgi:hypothetical protein